MHDRRTPAARPAQPPKPSKSTNLLLLERSPWIHWVVPWNWVYSQFKCPFGSRYPWRPPSCVTPFSLKPLRSSVSEVDGLVNATGLRRQDGRCHYSDGSGCRTDRLRDFQILLDHNVHPATSHRQCLSKADGMRNLRLSRRPYDAHGTEGPMNMVCKEGTITGKKYSLPAKTNLTSLKTETIL